MVLDGADRCAEALRDVAGWLAKGKLVAKEHVVTGGVRAFRCSPA